jgi:hypothetical protein
MKNPYNYKGVDVSLEISLNEYKFAYSVDDPRSQGDLRIIYGTAHGFGWADFSPTLDFWKEFSWIHSDDADDFLHYLGEDRATFDAHPRWMKIYDAINYFGAENICGTDYYPSTDWREVIAPSE